MEERLDEILRLALANKATDIHFSVRDNEITIEVRADQKIRMIPSSRKDIALIRYLQYRANMDVTDAMKPQTGQFECEVLGRPLSLRFALLHGFHMSSAVLRILNSIQDLTIESLATNREKMKRFAGLLNRRNGLILVTGPTGSGKTTTLYTLLQSVKQKKIYTLEDPIEIYCDRFVQIQLNEKQHLGYDEGIKQLLRHDPDIIMIGEIRDSEAAQMCIRCALTGHLVISSLHASSCSGAIARMLELGVAQHQLTDVLCGISNQRLYSQKNGKGRVSVYEFMEQQHISEYLQTKKLSPSFIPLQEEIKSAVRHGDILLKQALQDLPDGLSGDQSTS